MLNKTEQIEAIRQAGLLFESESQGVTIYFAISKEKMTILVARKGWSQSFDGLSVNIDGSYDIEPLFSSDNLREALSLCDGRT